ncbi:TetR family transcriptional regulator [soil metagenome]
MSKVVEGLRARKKADTRATIVRVASQLFADRGYQETSVALIAHDAGVSLPTLFRYFPTKADVLFDGADEIVEEWSTRLRAGPRAETLGAALRRATHELTVSTPQRGTAARLRAELAPHDPELRRKALEIDARVIGRIAEVIGDVLGIDADADPRAFLLASCAMAAVRSAQHVLGHTPRKRPLGAAIDQAFDALDGIGATLSRPVAVRVSSRTKRAAARPQVPLPR